MYNNMPDQWWEYGTTLVSKARTLSSARERAAAIAILIESVAWFRQAGSRIDTAEALRSLGITQSQARMGELAITSFDEALREITGRRNTEFLRGEILASKAITLGKLKRYPEALIAFDQAAESYRTAPFADIEHASCLRSKGITCSYAGRSEEAVSAVEQAAKTLSANPRYKEVVPVELAKCSRSLAIEYSKLGQTDKALTRFEEGLLRIKNVDHVEWLRAALLKNTAITLKHAGRGAAAREKLLEAMDAIDGVPGTRSQRLEILRRLVHQCNLLGLTSEANTYEKQVVNIKEEAQ